MGFWHNVEYVREFKNITRKELALKANFSLNSISAGIARDSVPSADVAVRIAEVLGVSVKYLVTGKDSSPSASLSPYSQKIYDFINDLTLDERKTLVDLIELLIRKRN